MSARVSIGKVNIYITLVENWYAPYGEPFPSLVTVPWLTFLPMILPVVDCVMIYGFKVSLLLRSKNGCIQHSLVAGLGFSHCSCLIMDVLFLLCVAGGHDSDNRWQSYSWSGWPWSSGNWNSYWETWYVCCCCWYQSTESMCSSSFCVHVHMFIHLFKHKHRHMVPGWQRGSAIFWCALQHG